MKDEEKQIEEMASILGNGCAIPCSKCRYANDCGELEGARKLYNADYRKTPENSVVLSADEFANLKKYAYEKGSKETADATLKWLKHLNIIDCFSIIEKYFKEQFGVEIKED